MAWQDLLGGPQSNGRNDRDDAGSAAGESWAHRLENLNEALEARFHDEESLRAAASAVVAFARRQQARVLIPASDLAVQLVDAAMHESPFDIDPRGQTVVVVDGLLASGTHMVRAADSARHAGAARVVGFAAVADGNALTTTRADIGDEVIAFEIA